MNRYLSLLFVCLLFCVPLFSNAQSNDECAGAIEIPVNAGNACASILNANTGQATASMAPCIGTQGKDVWYKFTATATTHRITLHPVSYTNLVMQSFSGSCGSLTPIRCTYPSGSNEPIIELLTNLVIGDTYYLRVFDKGGITNVDFTICIVTATTYIDNDECINAVDIVPEPGTTSCSWKQSNLIGATQSLPAACYGGNEDDVWYKFTATSSRHQIWVITSQSIYPCIELFSGSCGNLVSIGCYNSTNGGSTDQVSPDVNGLIAGNTYYYRVYGRATNNNRTNVASCVKTLPPGPANDECVGAINVPVNSDNSCTQTLIANTGLASQSLPPCFATNSLDVWYKFTATATSHRISIRALNYANLVMQSYSGSCGSLTPIRCTYPSGFDEPILELLTGLTIGNTYYFRVYDRGGITNIAFSICISTASSYIDNDECSGAMNIVPEAGNTTCAWKQASLIGATRSTPTACYGNNEDDIWFKFTATSTRHQIWVTTSQSIFPCLELFSGSCGNLVSIGCYNSTNGGSTEQVSPDISGLVPGNAYYYRVYGSAANNNRTNIATCIRTLPSGPVNDECTGAINVPVNGDNSCTQVLAANTGLATQSMPPCYATNSLDVWYKFTATSTSHRISLRATNYANLVMQSFSGSCGSLTPMHCTHPSGWDEPILELLTGLTIGNTYYFRVYDQGGITNIDFTICISTATTYIDNDECSGAIHIVPEPGLTGATWKQSNLTGATRSQPAACYGDNEDDVWYKFIAISSRHQIWVTTSQSINPVLELFTGTCGNLVPAGCFNISNGGNEDQVAPEFTNLIPGNQYYYRVYGESPANARCIIASFVRTTQVNATCPNTSISYLSEIYGSGYQWQVNTGSGFTNISDNLIYQGTNNQQLNLVNPPTTMYDYQYRCVVNGTTNSNPQTLKFISYWNGSVNTEWENPGNWSCGWVPDENTDVVISSGPVYINSSTSVRSIDIKPQASLHLTTGNTLDVKQP